MAFAIYPLNKQTRGRDLSARRAPTGYLSSVTSAVGPYGRPGGSFYLQGTSNSYIDFSNAASGKLDTWSAISIFLWVYPEEKPGPIVNYQRSGHGLGLWMSGTRVLEGRVYSRRNYYRRKLFFTHFLPRRWYYVGLMYDNNHGYATLWVNGRVVGWFSLYMFEQFKNTINNSPFKLWFMCMWLLLTNKLKTISSLKQTWLRLIFFKNTSDTQFPYLLIQLPSNVILIFPTFFLLYEWCIRKKPK